MNRAREQQNTECREAESNQIQTVELASNRVYGVENQRETEYKMSRVRQQQNMDNREPESNPEYKMSRPQEQESTDCAELEGKKILFL